MPNTEQQQQQKEQPTSSQADAIDTPPQGSGNEAKRKKMVWGGVALVAVVLIGIFATRYLLWTAGHEETDDAYLQGHIHAVSSRITGTVDRVLVNDNELVKEGELLLVLDPRDYQDKVALAQAAVDVALQQAQTAQNAIQFTARGAAAQRTEASGTIGESIAGIASAKASLVSAQAGVPKAEAELQRAQATQHREELDLERYKDLLAKGQVSRQTFEHVQQSYQVAVADSAAQQQAVSQAQAQTVSAEQSIVSAQAALQHSQGLLQSADASKLEVNVKDAQYSSAKASIGEAMTALQEAKLQLSYTQIISPVAGRIARKSVEAGQRLQPGQPLLAVVEDNPWIVANFKETQLENIRPAQTVEIRIDSFPHHAFRGHVDSVAPGSGNEFALLPPDNATGNFTKIVQRVPVKIVFDADSVRGFTGLFVPGSSAVVTVATRERR